MKLTKKNIVLASPFLIIGISFGIAFLFGNIIGKWAFIPVIMVHWCLFLFFTFIYRKGNKKKMATKITKFIRLEYFSNIYWNTSTSVIFNPLRNIRIMASLVTLDFIGSN